MTKAGTPGLAAQNVTCAKVDLSLDIDTIASGFNPALQRLPRLDVQAVPLGMEPAFVPSWKPRKIPVRCIGLTLPEGAEFLPTGDVTETASDGTNLRKIESRRNSTTASSNSRQHKRTRVKPPPGAVSLQDRLFYLLQPPLETWLAGQELIMPLSLPLAGLFCCRCWI